MPYEQEISARTRSPSSITRGRCGLYDQAGGPYETGSLPEAIDMPGVMAPCRRHSAMPAANTDASLTPGRTARNMARAMASPTAAAWPTTASSSADWGRVRVTKPRSTDLKVSWGSCWSTDDHNVYGMGGSLWEGGQASRPSTPIADLSSPCARSASATPYACPATSMFSGLIHTASPRALATRWSPMRGRPDQRDGLADPGEDDDRAGTVVGEEHVGRPLRRPAVPASAVNDERVDALGVHELAGEIPAPVPFRLGERREIHADDARAAPPARNLSHDRSSRSGHTSRPQ